ncbi:cell surface glycoprotein 1-like isoform X1 [Penaeus chinensis]|uniref:cell surface glycoprotein 1-like isoform X1 n=1 Tax=Penaeus chinensis TaxID=139456 RepID=UPI001FB62C30|nr:cell surface glycoprotein 1-like isoform X1 [Penaeus chinensis]
MKFFGRVAFMLIIAVLLLYLTSETEARGGRGGGGRGGGRGSSSRGGSRGWFSSGGSSKSSVGYGGGLKSGGYASFGSPNRWSNVGGRRIYYVGYYHGYHGGYGYHGGRYSNSRNPYEGRGSGLTATGLVVLLLAIIGIGVGLYYAYICLRARPLRPRQPPDSEHGPLISPDPDVNGNHEDVPLEASAPTDEEDPEKVKKIIEEPNSKKDPADPPASDSPKDTKTPNGYPKEKDEVLVPVEEVVAPANISHEKETVPVVNHVAPIGLVAPLGLVIPAKTEPPAKPTQPEEPENKTTPKKLQPEAKKPESQPPASGSPPAPIYVPVPLAVKKPVTDSDEEDGLLLQKCSPHDDSLDPEQCPQLTALTEQVKTTPEPDAEALPIQNPPLQPSAPEAPETPTPETPSPVKEAEASPQAEGPEIVVVPKPDVGYGWKEHEVPVKRAPDSVPPEVVEQPATPLMKEDVENLQPVHKVDVPITVDIEELDDPVEPVFEVKDISRDLKASPPQKPVREEKPIQEVPPAATSKNDEPVESPQELKSKEIPVAVTSLPEEPLESSDDSVEYPPVVYLETCQPTQDARPTSECSGSSEEALPPYPDSTPEKETTAKNGSEKAQVEGPAAAKGEDEGSERKTKPDAVESPNMTKAPLQTDPGLPLVMPTVIPTNKPVSDAPDAPLEAYIPDLNDEYGLDPMNADDNSLAVIKEEGSTCTESETDSSEPEVTEYSFSSGPTAPTTSDILADEVSCSMEPEVTKYSVISDVEAEELQSSDTEVSETETDSVVLSTTVDPEEKTNASSDQKPGNPKPCQSEPDSSTNEILTPNTTHQRDSVPVTTSDSACTQLADSTNAPSHASLSSSDDSEDESDGAEAEPELREEVVKIPTASQDEPSSENVTASSSDLPASSSVAEESSGQETKNRNTPERLRTEEKKNGTLQSVPDSTDNDFMSTPSSSPCSSDLSDDEVTTSTPKKSKIPRLVSHQES